MQDQPPIDNCEKRRIIKTLLVALQYSPVWEDGDSPAWDGLLTPNEQTANVKKECAEQQLLCGATTLNSTSNLIFTVT